MLCKQFKFGASGRVVQLSATSKPPAGAASQPIWLGGVACNGNEATLQVREREQLFFNTWLTWKNSAGQTHTA